jgi:hypothetical protein
MPSCAPPVARPPGVPASGPSAPSALARKPARNYIFGQITHIQPDEWTVHGIKGNIYTVRVSSLTVFGDLFNGAKRTEFKVGEHVRVAGVFVGTAVNATAVDHWARPPRR